MKLSTNQLYKFSASIRVPEDGPPARHLDACPARENDPPSVACPKCLQIVCVRHERFKRDVRKYGRIYCKNRKRKQNGRLLGKARRCGFRSREVRVATTELLHVRKLKPCTLRDLRCVLRHLPVDEDEHRVHCLEDVEHDLTQKRMGSPSLKMLQRLYTLQSTRYRSIYVRKNTTHIEIKSTSFCGIR